MYHKTTPFEFLVQPLSSLINGKGACYIEEKSKDKVKQSFYMFVKLFPKRASKAENAHLLFQFYEIYSPVFKLFFVYFHPTFYGKNQVSLTPKRTFMYKINYQYALLEKIIDE